MSAQPLWFHGEDVPPSAPEKALFHVIPAPLESSVSYGAGTKAGPRAILEASYQLELQSNGCVPAEQGIHTIEPLDCSGPVQQVLQRISQPVGAALALNKIPFLLGGEHTVTLGAIPALKNQVGEFGVIQFDAHADLRDIYQGSKLSHACVMRRIHEQNIPILQLGTRSYSQEEQTYRLRHGIPFYDSRDIWQGGPGLTLPADFPAKVYVSFDIDGLDSSLMPATGTPVPGGLSWQQAMALLERIMEQRICIGLDLVEYAPIPGFHAYSFTAAQLAYDMMACLVKSGPNAEFHGISQS